MAMTYERFERVVRRLERTARQNPTGYKIRLLLLGALGYAYIFLTLGLALGLLAGLIWFVAQNPEVTLRAWRIVIPVGASLGWFCLIVLSSLRVGLPPPVGMVLHREQAVPLFQLVDRLRTGL